MNRRQRTTRPQVAPDSARVTGVRDQALSIPDRSPPWNAWTWVLLAASMALVLFVRLQGVSLEGLERRAAEQAVRNGSDAASELAGLQSAYTFTTEDGRRFRYPQEIDGYFWMRVARRYVETGTPCDEVVGGICRDTYANAPIGREQVYGKSLHVVALAWLHRVMSWLDPGLPIMATAPWLSILVAAFGVIPGFAIGRRLAGDVAGFVAGPLAMLHPDLLWRSSGADNDIWNVVMPLVAAWMAIEASLAGSLRCALSYAVLAGFAVGMHAAIWSGWTFGFAVLLAALAGHAGIEASSLLAARVRADVEAQAIARAGSVRAALVAAVFTAATLVAVSCFVSPNAAIEIPVAVVQHASHHLLSSENAVDPPRVFAPDHFKMVTELAKPKGAGAEQLGGAAVYFLAWLGVLLLLLPPRRIETWHFALIVGANVLFRHVWAHEEMSALSFALLLFAPLAATLLAIAWFDRRSAEYRNASILIVIVWFLAAVVLSRDAMRFQMFLAAPFAIGVGIFFGRLFLWLRALLEPWLLETLAPRSSNRPKAARPVLEDDGWKKRVAAGVTVAQTLVFAGAVLVLVAPAQQGVATLRDALPMVNGAWVAALESIRGSTPPETIVQASWDQGYWVEFFADRRTTSDGASLTTDLPYWTARALLAKTDREMAGLLRMLNCGSAAISGPEAERSAHYRLVRAGMHPSLAPAFLARLATGTRDEATGLLRSVSIEGDQARTILEATHCEPPPSVVVVSTRLINVNGWRLLGNWDFVKAYVANRSIKLPPEQAIQELTTDLRLEENEARGLLLEAASMRPELRPARFISDLGGWLRADWSPCVEGPVKDASIDRVWSCPLASSASAAGVESVEYSINREGDVIDVAVWSADGRGKRTSALPALVLAARGGQIRTIREEPVKHSAALAGNPAVLIDLETNRILAGAPAAISSGLTRLYFLDDRYSPSFRKVDDRQVSAGERVVVWKTLTAAEAVSNPVQSSAAAPQPPPSL